MDVMVNMTFWTQDSFRANRLKGTSNKFSGHQMDVIVNTTFRLKILLAVYFESPTKFSGHQMNSWTQDSVLTKFLKEKPNKFSGHQVDVIMNTTFWTIILLRKT